MSCDFPGEVNTLSFDITRGVLNLSGNLPCECDIFPRSQTIVCIPGNYVLLIKFEHNWLSSCDQWQSCKPIIMLMDQ